MLGVFDLAGSPVGNFSVSVGDVVKEGIRDNRTLGLLVGTAVAGTIVGTKGAVVGLARALGSIAVGVVVGIEGVIGAVDMVGEGGNVGVGMEPTEGSAVSRIRVGNKVLLLEGGGARGGGIGTSIVSSYRLGTRSNRFVPI